MLYKMIGAMLPAGHKAQGQKWSRASSRMGHAPRLPQITHIDFALADGVPGGGVFSIAAVTENLENGRFPSVCFIATIQGGVNDYLLHVDPATEDRWQTKANPTSRLGLAAMVAVIDGHQCWLFPGKQ